MVSEQSQDNLFVVSESMNPQNSVTNPREIPVEILGLNHHLWEAAQIIAFNDNPSDQEFVARLEDLVDELKAAKQSAVRALLRYNWQSSL